MEKLHWSLKGLLLGILFVSLSKVLTPLVEGEAIDGKDLALDYLIYSVGFMLFWLLIDVISKRRKAKKDSTSQ
jgi:hypothetical protein